MIESKEYLKNIQIVCRENKDVENCLNMLEELGFKVINNDNKYKVIYYSYYNSRFENDIRLECEKNTYFFNKKFIKILQKFLKEEQEKKEKGEDFEVAEDGRITKINNYESEKEIFISNSREGDKIKILYPVWSEEAVKQGLAYATQKAKDRAIFKSEIETRLKNIAEKLNNGQKINWEDENQNKYEIFYNFNNGGLYGWSNTNTKEIGQIYCLDENFLNVAKQEIGEDKLIKYFKE